MHCICLQILRVRIAGMSADVLANRAAGLTVAAAIARLPMTPGHLPQRSDPLPLKAYWQPGCTSCLRMKEFLSKHGVSFVSVNVLEDANARDELAAFGVRSVPIIARGSVWANGQVLADVARVAGISLWRQAIPPATRRPIDARRC